MVQALADLLAANAEALGRPRPQALPAKPKMRYSHQAMCDLIVENPWISQNEIAAAFGYSVGWISQIITSDAFQALLASRRIELVDPEIRATIEERTKALVIQSQKILMDKLNKPADMVPSNVALRAFELGAKALGIGGNAPPPPVSTPERLNELGERLVVLLKSKREGVTLDGQVREIKDITPVSGHASSSEEVPR